MSNTVLNGKKRKVEIIILLMAFILTLVTTSELPAKGEVAPYTSEQNGTIVSSQRGIDSVLITYTIRELRELNAAAQPLDLDTFLSIGDRLPFTDETSAEFAAKYLNGDWYLLATVKTIDGGGDNRPEDYRPSEAYLVTNNGLAGLEFIFITNPNEVFTVHIDTAGTNATVQATLTEYTEVLTEVTAEAPAAVPETLPEKVPDETTDEETEESSTEETPVEPSESETSEELQEDETTTDETTTDETTTDETTTDETQTEGATAEDPENETSVEDPEDFPEEAPAEEQTTAEVLEEDTEKAPETIAAYFDSLDALRVRSLVDAGDGAKIVRLGEIDDPSGDYANELVTLEPTDVEGAEFIVEQPVVVAAIVIGEEQGNNDDRRPRLDENTIGLKEGQVWTNKEIEVSEVFDHQFIVTLSAWAREYSPGILIDGTLVITDYLGSYYNLTEVSETTLSTHVDFEGSPDVEFVRDAGNNITAVKWSIKNNDPELLDQDYTELLTLPYSIELKKELLDDAETSEGLYETDHTATATYTPNKDNLHYYSKEVSYNPELTLTWNSNMNAKGVNSAKLNDSVYGIEIVFTSFDFDGIKPVPSPPYPEYIKYSENYFKVNGNSQLVKIWYWGAANNHHLYIVTANPNLEGSEVIYEIPGVGVTNGILNSPTTVSATRIVEYATYHPNQKYDGTDDNGVAYPVNDSRNFWNGIDIDSSRTVPMDYVGWTKLVHPITVYKYNATEGGWLDKVQFTLSGEGQSGTFETDGGKFVLPYLKPGTYTLHEVPESVPVGFKAITDDIAFTVSDPEVGKFSPTITSVVGGISSYDSYSGLFLFIGNERNLVTFNISKIIDIDTLYADVHGDPTFLFEIKQLAANGDTINTWVRSITTQVGNLTDIDGKPVPAEAEPLPNLEIGYRYEITELYTMRYILDGGVKVTGIVGVNDVTPDGNTITIDLTDSSVLVPMGQGETQYQVYVDFTNIKVVYQYLSDTDVRVNKFNFISD